VAPAKRKTRPTDSPESPGQAWPADKVERRPVAGLIPYARNARAHSEEQVAQIAASIREWGWTMPVLVDERDEIIAGHGRVLAAQRLGLAQIPVMVARGWSDAQKRAYVIADNKLTLNAGWDAALLTLELGDLKEAGFDLGLTGFLDGEIGELFARAAIKAGLTDPDEVPPAPAIPVSKLGDVWLLGASVTCPKCGKSSPLEKAAAKPSSSGK
jgi:ParB-like chromosome segregation protein Spo0J